MCLKFQEHVGLCQRLQDYVRTQQRSVREERFYTPQPPNPRNIEKL